MPQNGHQEEFYDNRTLMETGILADSSHTRSTLLKETTRYMTENCLASYEA